jgi:hypothetical protein
VPMYTPPVDDGDPGAPRAGLTCFVFPAWFVAQVEGELFTTTRSKPYRTRPLVHWRGLDGGKQYVHDGKKVPVVPVRFVQACRNGHISDIDWYRFVHGGPAPARPPVDRRGRHRRRPRRYLHPLRGDRRPPSARRRQAPDSRVLGRCRGERPWLGNKSSEPCSAQGRDDAPEWSRLLVRSASNAYFAQVLRVISCPRSTRRCARRSTPAGRTTSNSSTTSTT